MRYKTSLHNWLKRAGSGSEVSTIFKGWDNDKLLKYNVDPDTCNHTDISSRSSILIHNYSKQIIPSITMIFLWNKQADFHLVWYHDKINIGGGDPGMDDSDDNISNSLTDSLDPPTPSPK